MSAVELKRLKDTFSKYGTSGGMLLQSVFFSDILGDTVPNNLAEVCCATAELDEPHSSSNSLFLSISSSIQHGVEQQRVSISKTSCVD